MQLHLFIFQCFVFAIRNDAFDFFPPVKFFQVHIQVVLVAGGETAFTFRAFLPDFQVLDLDMIGDVLLLSHFVVTHFAGVCCLKASVRLLAHGCVCHDAPFYLWRIFFVNEGFLYVLPANCPFFLQPGFLVVQWGLARVKCSQLDGYIPGAVLRPVVVLYKICFVRPETAGLQGASVGTSLVSLKKVVFQGSVAQECTATHVAGKGFFDVNSIDVAFHGIV